VGFGELSSSSAAGGEAMTAYLALFCVLEETVASTSTRSQIALKIFLGWDFAILGESMY